MTSSEKTSNSNENVVREEKRLVSICGEAPPEYWKKIQKEIDETGYYTCSSCGKKSDLCGHACTGFVQQPTPPTQIFQFQNPQANVMVAIPTGAQNDVEWSMKFGLEFIPRMCPPNTSVVFENRYGIATAREALVNTFLANNIATHLLFFDSDILPIELHGLHTLIADSLADKRNYIVSGIYYNSLYSGLNCWKNEKALTIAELKQNQNPLVEVDKIGMGYCLIRKDLFNLIVLEDRPLFYYKVHEGNVMESEDFIFLKKIGTKYGIKPFVDYRVTAQHIKRCKVGVDGSIQF